MINIVEKRKIFYTLSLLLLAGSAVSLFLFRVNFGIDFKGGSLLELSFNQNRPDSSQIMGVLEAFNLGNILVQPSGERNLILKFNTVDEVTHQQIISRLASSNVGSFREERFEAIGPTIGQELKRKATLAVVLVLIAIILYIAWAFRHISKPVASWKYGLVAVAALLHDVTIPIGLFSILSRFYGYEIDVLFVTAILTVLGFSVHDTIVVFDRIRENLRKARGENFESVVEKSIHETITRSINTSLTVFLVLLGVYFLGGDSTRVFSLVMLSGVFFGTYSSIFIASPLLVTWHNFSQRP